MTYFQKNLPKLTRIIFYLELWVVSNFRKGGDLFLKSLDKLSQIKNKTEVIILGGKENSKQRLLIIINFILENLKKVK